MPLTHAVAILKSKDGTKKFVDTVNETEYKAGNMAKYYKIELLTQFQTFKECKDYLALHEHRITRELKGKK